MAVEKSPGLTNKSMAVEKITLSSLRKGLFGPGKAESCTPFAALTCYDATTARWLARAGVHVLLVGDTAAEMVLGHPRTTDMPLDILLALTAAVKRGVLHAAAEAQGHSGTSASTSADTYPGTVQPLIMGDMPFLSYHLSEDDAVANAGKFLVEGQADIVKLEVDASFAPRVARMVGAGIPICAHIGSRPQLAALTGGYSSAGRTAHAANSILHDAETMLAAGASMLLVEAVPGPLAEQLTAMCSKAQVPLIGIGAGSSCHGQVLVLHDLLGLTDRAPVFATPVANLGQLLVQAGRAWVDTVAERAVQPSPYRARSESPQAGMISAATPAPAPATALPSAANIQV